MSMKRYLTIERIVILIAVTLAFVLACPAVSAQTPGNSIGQQFAFGFRGGLSWAEIVYEGRPLFDGNSRVSFTAGAFWAIPVTSRFAVQPELTWKRYRQSSYMVFTSPDYPDGYASGDYYYSLDNVAVSSLVRFQPLREGLVIPMLLAGPRIDINVQAEQGFEDNLFSIPDEKRVTFGLDFGGMLLINLETPIFIDIRGSLGLTDVFAIRSFQFEDGSSVPITLGIRGNMISVTGGFMIL